MKYITLMGGKTYHLLEEGRKTINKNTGNELEYHNGTAYCGKWASEYRDRVVDTPPEGRTMCKQCKKAVLNKLGEDGLFLEMV